MGTIGKKYNGFSGQDHMETNQPARGLGKQQRGPFPSAQGRCLFPGTRPYLTPSRKKGGGGVMFKRPNCVPHHVQRCENHAKLSFHPPDGLEWKKPFRPGKFRSGSSVERVWLNPSRLEQSWLPAKATTGKKEKCLCLSFF